MLLLAMGRWEDSRDTFGINYLKSKGVSLHTKVTSYDICSKGTSSALRTNGVDLGPPMVIHSMILVGQPLSKQHKVKTKQTMSQ